MEHEELILTAARKKGKCYMEELYGAYCEEAKAIGLIPISYTAFSKKVKALREKKRVKMRMINLLRKRGGTRWLVSVGEEGPESAP